MSYSYTDLLSSIITARSNNEPHTALGHYAELSEKCSMTPLLWIQYAQDSTSVDSSFFLAKEVCEMALEEFPGCVLLWMYFLDISCSTAGSTNGTATEESWSLWNNAMKSIKGLQSPPVVLEFYRLATRYLPEKAEEIFIDRAYSILEGNETIVDEIQSYANEHGISISSQTFASIENGRKFVSQNMNILKRCEEEVTVAISTENIQLPSSFSFADYKEVGNPNAPLYDWNGIINALGGLQGRILMGYGMMQTASSFLNYVQHLFQHIKYLRRQLQKDDEEEARHTSDLIKMFTNIIVPTYERALSECPTVEILWEKYVKHLTYVFHNADEPSSPAQRANVLIQLQNVTSRAVKNCPYSLKLFTMKMQIVLEEVEAGRKLLEPDDLMKIVKEAVDGQFLPDRNSHLEIHLAACRLVKRRIMHIISKATSSTNYDEAERLEKDSKKKRKKGEDVELKLFTAPLEEDTEQEVQDLIEDLREMYDSADMFLRKKYSDWTEGRYLLYKERATFEAYVCTPMVHECNNDNAIKCYEKMVRVHHPPHPDAWRDYIKYMMGKSFIGSSVEDDGAEGNDVDIKELPGMVIAKLRFVRNLYQRALSSTKKVSMEEKDIPNLQYIAAMRLLCDDYRNFESAFGSEKSHIVASKLISKKLAPVLNNSSLGNSPNELVLQVDKEDENQIQDRCSSKRKREIDEVEVAISYHNDENPSDQPPYSKKVKINDTEGLRDYDIQDKNETAQSTAHLSEKGTNQEKAKNIWPIKSKPEHFVKIGKIDYPAHPYTVHVSNLAIETMDMDLYDLFRSKCGAVVHARIFREKQHSPIQNQVPKSKCAALVQFEERESVEKALELGGEIGLHEKLIVVARSHQPAVGVVPPGMHRIKPKGQGKHTNRNVRRKERRLATSATANGNEEVAAGKSNETSKDETFSETKHSEDKTETKKATSSSNVLLFRPRNIVQKTRKKKVGL